MMRCVEPGWVLCAMNDPTGRRGIWYRLKDVSRADLLHVLCVRMTFNEGPDASAFVRQAVENFDEIRALLGAGEQEWTMDALRRVALRADSASDIAAWGLEFPDGKFFRWSHEHDGSFSGPREDAARMSYAEVHERRWGRGAYHALSQTEVVWLGVKEVSDETAV